MEEAITAGVSSYNVGSIAPGEVKPVLRAAVALFRRHQAQNHAIRAALTEAEARLRDRAALDRAKSILMRARKFSEPEAHRWLQRQAMLRGRRMIEIAETVIAEAEATP